MVIEAENDKVERKNQQSDAKTEALRQLVAERKLELLVSNRSLTSNILQATKSIQQLSILLEKLTTTSEAENQKLTEIKKALAQKSLDISQTKNRILSLTSQIKNFHSQKLKDIEYRQEIFDQIKKMIKSFKETYEMHSKSLLTVNAKLEEVKLQNSKLRSVIDCQRLKIYESQQEMAE